MINQFSKPYSESCDMNQEVISKVLEKYLLKSGVILEIGSGTGQHAVYFANKFPNYTWQPADVAENIPGMKLWFDEAQLSNIKEPEILNVDDYHGSTDSFDFVYSANTVHIMSWSQVEKLFKILQTVLKPAAIFILYGPFSYNFKQTSESNQRFDLWLKGRDPLSGVRDFSDLNKLASDSSLVFQTDIEMPVNNRILVWKKIES